MRSSLAAPALSFADDCSWFERERARQERFFRFLLPLAGEALLPEPTAAPEQASRPEFYDFDLFAQGSQDAALAERTLADLAYTVFDTETTGLAPSQGDEIIQIGATRIVAGKLRRQECFEQLVDPQRSVLDTWLLSAVVHPQQESHSLEAMCERLGVSMLGRHMALGDAMVTAEVFLRLLPLLQALGITTLGQALEASRKTYLARVTY